MESSLRSAQPCKGESNVLSGSRQRPPSSEFRALEGGLGGRKAIYSPMLQMRKLSLKEGKAQPGSERAPGPPRSALSLPAPAGQVPGIVWEPLPDLAQSRAMAPQGPRAAWGRAGTCEPVARGMPSQGPAPLVGFQARKPPRSIVCPQPDIAPGQACGRGVEGEGQRRGFAPAEHHLWALSLVLILIHTQE